MGHPTPKKKMMLKITMKFAHWEANLQGCHWSNNGFFTPKWVILKVNLGSFKDSILDFHPDFFLGRFGYLRKKLQTVKFHESWHKIVDFGRMTRNM